MTAKRRALPKAGKLASLRRGSSHRGTPTNLENPGSSLAGLQQRATRTGSWPNMSSLASPPHLIVARLVVRTTPSKKFRNQTLCRMHRGILTKWLAHRIGFWEQVLPQQILRHLYGIDDYAIGTHEAKRAPNSGLENFASNGASETRCNPTLQETASELISLGRSGRIRRQGLEGSASRFGFGRDALCCTAAWRRIQ